MANQQKKCAPAKMKWLSLFDLDVLERNKILQELINDYMEEKTNMKMQECFSNTSHCYNMRNAFSKPDSYWIRMVQDRKLKGTLSRGILYRPDIVNEMMQLIETCLQQEDCAEGIIIKGPQGIGKSHSIINLVRKLLYDSNDKYLVTFVPDCEEWTSLWDLYDSICSSFGCDASHLGFNDMGSTPNEDKRRFKDFVETIDSILAERGMKWVFVFDQINSLFARPKYNKTKDLGAISFPFCAIKSVLKAGHITSIVSASTDNTRAYRNYQPDFVEYNHCCRMRTDEINAVFQEVTNQSEEERNMVYKLTGCVPFQVAKLISSEFSIEEYQNKALHAILTYLNELKSITTSRVFQGITHSAVACLLHLHQEGKNYDCKYSVPPNSDEKYFKPLFPMVLVAYRRFFWDSVLTSLKRNERHMLLACQNEAVFNDTCGQLFELMVINHCSMNADINVQLDVAWGFPHLHTCTLVETFDSMRLPRVLKENGMYVPLNSNFPAIHLIWKCNTSVCGVHVHVHNAAHQRVVKEFEKLCTMAAWFEKFEHVYLLYLSPTQHIASLVQKCICQQQGRVMVAAASIHNISCLANLEWPDVHLH